MNSHEVFIHIHQGCFAGTGAIVRLPQCQWSKPAGYGKISQCITTTKQKPCAYFLGYTVNVHSANKCWTNFIPYYYKDKTLENNMSGWSKNNSNKCFQQETFWNFGNQGNLGLFTILNDIILHSILDIFTTISFQKTSYFAFNLHRNANFICHIFCKAGYRKTSSWKPH